MDRDLMATVFHPAATVRYPAFEGPWLRFVDWVWGLHRAFDSHSHQMANAIIRLDPDRRSAVSESYVSATFWQRGVNGAVAENVLPAGTQTEVRARYLDNWSLADACWRIDHRICVVDIKTEQPAVGLVGEGRRDFDDPSYRLGDFAARLIRPRGEVLA
jgi:acetylornithine deacetylase/succinyl-diaminopimelate desuccinylase-like protein